MLSIVATEEVHLKEAESLAREACALVERFGLQGNPQAAMAHMALGRVLAEGANLDEAEGALESALSVRQTFPDLSPWGYLIGLLALAKVRLGRGERGGARAALAEARDVFEAFPDAGIFPELLERQERKLGASKKRREEPLNWELTQRELDVLGLLESTLTTSQMAQSLYISPNTVRTYIKSIYRKLEVSSREEAVEQACARGLI
jgi:LuxR family maltose regulon positive regulatory protein